jgi:hypothetical protein
MKKKTTIGGVPPKPAKNTTGATNRTSGYLNPNAAGNKKAAPKTTVTKSGRKITVSASTSGGSGANSGKSLKFGGIGQSTKVVPSKPQPTAKKKPMSTALKSKVQGAMAESRAARGNLYVVQEAKKLGNLQGPGVAAKKLKEANQRVLDTGRTASRAQNILNRAKKK